ncbi:unnamed protein product [Rotaria sp. Silwood2]|nr:unnamed protein product [Rotaria sp. Silwood2]
MHIVNIIFIGIFTVASNYCLGTPLDDYVNTPDPVFSWTRLHTNSLSTHTFYILNMTSQRWFDDSFSSQAIWWHYLTITVPKAIRRPKTAFLLIAHGENTNPMPTTDITTELALIANCITATIHQIPNQPFHFKSDPLKKSRREDDLIAWTWKKFLETNGSDPTVLLRFPMTKAVVRAMDTVQQFIQQQNLVAPEEFVIGGFSKNLGGWTFAFKDYYDLNITRYTTSPALAKLASMVDPYAYFDRYSKMKILQIQGAGDEFFLPDSEDPFWDDLQVATGGSFLQRIPNTGHNVQGFQDSLASFYLSVADRTLLPSMKWTRTSNGTHGIIRLAIDFTDGKPKPTAVTAYQARTSDTLRRDFRLSKLDRTNGRVVRNPVTWANTGVQFEVGQIGSTASYSVTIPIPIDDYWIATFLQATFPGSQGIRMVLTTETLILPNTYPTPECHDQECYGQLV